MAVEMEQIKQRLVALNAQSTESFSAVVELLLKKSSSAGTTKLAEITRVRMSDHVKSYVIIPGAVVEASSNIHVLLDSADFQPKLKTVFEGSRFVVGDFVVGVLSVNQNARLQPNLLLEVCLFVHFAFN